MRFFGSQRGTNHLRLKRLQRLVQSQGLLDYSGLEALNAWVSSLFITFHLFILFYGTIVTGEYIVVNQKQSP